MARWHSANVLKTGPDARHLWQFAAHNGTFELLHQEVRPPGEPLSSNLVRKDWQTLWQKKLNVAWLPPEKVFLRAIRLPAADLAETLAMVELQLEKISPMPVAQIVWTIEVLPHTAGDLQTVIVMIVARHAVEEFLGQLENQGFLADRLDLPVLDQLLAVPINDDGVWIYPGLAASSACLIAWWYGGILQNLVLLSLPTGEEQVPRLQEQLSQMSWAGELEGWLTAPPRWHLVADADTAALWQPALQSATGESIDVITPLAPAELAALSARRGAHSVAKVTLLPAEFAARYQQQFIDRLWMRGLGAVLVVYLFGVLIYFGALEVLKFQRNQVQKRVSEISQSYTNAIQTSNLVTVLQAQVDLKYAALDCWKAAAEYLPADVTLKQLQFKKGRELNLSGEVPQEQVNQLDDYIRQLRRTTAHDRPLFKNISAPRHSFRPAPTGGSVDVWSFDCEINRTETE